MLPAQLLPNSYSTFLSEKAPLNNRILKAVPFGTRPLKQTIRTILLKFLSAPREGKNCRWGAVSTVRNPKRSRRCTMAVSGYQSVEGYKNTSGQQQCCNPVTVSG